MVEFIRNREELEHLLITKQIEGFSIRYLSRHYGLSRNTVRGILRKHKARRDQGHNILIKKKHVKRISKLDAYEPLIKEWINKFPNITGQRLYEKLIDAGYKGGITIVRDRFKQLRPKPKRNPVVRFETEPGKQGQMDWSSYTINFTRTGKSKVLCFSYILGYSRRHYIDFTKTRDFYTLIRRHQDAFEYFGGVPKQCLYDGEKTILLRWEANRPVFHPPFIAFITHYHCKPIMCKPGRPETKGKIEAPFQYVEKNLLNAREFYDLDDLKGKGRWWMKDRSDWHIHDTTGWPPIELFIGQEQAALEPLPLHPYDCSEVGYRVCDFDAFIDFETNQYSVPYEVVGEILAFKACEHEIFIYSPFLDLIAYHERLPAGACQSKEKPEHRSSQKVRYGLEPVRENFLGIGYAAEKFLQGLKEKYPRNCGFHARYILGLKKKYHCDDINNALFHAARYCAFDGKAIERILGARAKTRPLESMRNEKARQCLEKTLPKIKQRPLSEYKTLFLNEKESDEKEPESPGRDNCSDQDASKDLEADKNGKMP